MSDFAVGSLARIVGEFPHHPAWTGAVTRIVAWWGWDIARDEPSAQYALVEFEDGAEFVDGLSQCNIPISALEPLVRQ